MNNECPLIKHCNNGEKDTTCHFSPTATWRNILLYRICLGFNETDDILRTLSLTFYKTPEIFF